MSPAGSPSAIGVLAPRTFDLHATCRDFLGSLRHERPVFAARVDESSWPGTDQSGIRTLSVTDGSRARPTATGHAARAARARPRRARRLSTRAPRGHGHARVPLRSLSIAPASLEFRQSVTVSFTRKGNQPAAARTRVRALACFFFVLFDAHAHFPPRRPRLRATPLPFARGRRHVRDIYAFAVATRVA